MSNYPPAFLPVLFGSGSFPRDRAGNIKRDEYGNPRFIVPNDDSFLTEGPRPDGREPYPFGPNGHLEAFPGADSLVLLAISTNTDCRDPDLITEIGYTVFDTAAIFNGARVSQWRKKAIAGCEAPGRRGQNIAKLGTSRHFIVKDTARHHEDSCKSPHHTAQPYRFAFRKSVLIERDEVPSTLENAFLHAEREGLTAEQWSRGCRRKVVLVVWGDQNQPDLIDAGESSVRQPQRHLHAAAQQTTWFRERRHNRTWDVRLFEAARVRFPTPTPDSLLAYLDAFGVNHRAHGAEIGHNAGNKSAFAIRLLLAYAFLTRDERDDILAARNLRPEPAFPGVEAVLARDNRPPDAAPLPEGYVPFPHAPARQ
ncbi:hypothetical protein F5Y17DRAFT_473975 [Xylariaceae sp. FL0594]|nr:hypothetical protein F5Y17DRAFT_473975 [Xylariaceae sp. FL0594]